MSVLVRSRVRSVVSVSRVARAGGGDDSKPRWTLPAADYHKHTFQPSIPDKHFNVGHFNYAPVTLWLRARRPTMEKVVNDTWDTVSNAVLNVYAPVKDSVDSHLPGFGYKVFGFLGFLLGWNVVAMYWTDRLEAYFLLEKLRLFSVGKQLDQHSFFASESEDNDLRMQDYNQTVARLETEFENAYARACEERNFDVLVQALGDHSHAVHEVPKPISWRLGMMPYGRENPDATTFAWGDADTPAANNYFFLDAGSVGDYPERTDNKPNPIRKARHMYTSAYMPPTK